MAACYFGIMRSSTGRPTDRPRRIPRRTRIRTRRRTRRRQKPKESKVLGPRGLQHLRKIIIWTHVIRNSRKNEVLLPQWLHNLRKGNILDPGRLQNLRKREILGPRASNTQRKARFSAPGVSKPKENNGFGPHRLRPTDRDAPRDAPLRNRRLRPLAALCGRLTCGDLWAVLPLSTWKSSTFSSPCRSSVPREKQPWPR